MHGAFVTGLSFKFQCSAATLTQGPRPVRSLFSYATEIYEVSAYFVVGGDGTMERAFTGELTHVGFCFLMVRSECLLTFGEQIPFDCQP